MKANREIIDIQRNMQQVQGNINSMYTTIGKMYYSRNVNSPEPEYAAIINEIKASEKTLADMNTRIKFLNGVVTCTKCGADNGVVSAFCSVCGERLPHKVNVNDPTKCRNCGSPLVAGRNFCGVCGTPVTAPKNEEIPVAEPKDEDIPVAEPKNEEIQVAEPQNEEVFVTEPQSRESAAVESQIEEFSEAVIDENNITTYPFTNEEKPVADQEPVAKDEERAKFCPKCGTKARTIDALFCAECGTRF